MRRHALFSGAGLGVAIAGLVLAITVHAAEPVPSMPAPFALPSAPAGSGLGPMARLESRLQFVAAGSVSGLGYERESVVFDPVSTMSGWPLSDHIGAMANAPLAWSGHDGAGAWSGWGGAAQRSPELREIDKTTLALVALLMIGMVAARRFS